MLLPLVLLSMVANSLQFSSILWRTRHSSRSQLQCEVVAEEIKDVPPRSIGVASYFEKTMTTFGKTPITKLREVIKKYNPDVILPEDVGDLDSHCMLAMDSIWSASQDPAMSMGDDVVWPTFMMMLDKELSSTVKVVDAAIQTSVDYANTLSESRIKDLIIKYESTNAIPKLDRKKNTGKFGKGDYAVVLMDILRETNDNDYTKVMEILSTHKQESKGFGSSGKS